MRLVKVSVFLAAVVFSAVGLLCLVALRSVSVSGQAQGGDNGDVNCDGKLGIDDAVYILRHLFNGEPAPCALAEDRGMKGLIEKVDELAKAVWPPKPENIVNLYVAAPRDKDEAVYTVPERKWLIVTDIITYPKDPYYILSIIEKQGRDEITRADILQAEPIKQTLFHYGVGLKFAPESTLHLDSSPIRDIPKVQIIGYLADD